MSSMHTHNKLQHRTTKINGWLETIKSKWNKTPKLIITENFGFSSAYKIIQYVYTYKSAIRK